MIDRTLRRELVAHNAVPQPRSHQDPGIRQRDEIAEDGRAIELGVGETYHELGVTEWDGRGRKRRNYEPALFGQAHAASGEQ